MKKFIPCVERVSTSYPYTVSKLALVTNGDDRYSAHYNLLLKHEGKLLLERYPWENAPKSPVTFATMEEAVQHCKAWALSSNADTSNYKFTEGAITVDELQGSYVYLSDVGGLENFPEFVALENEVIL